ncbi:MAG: Fur family transcriptional regulator [Vulcanisaeta sp.]
MERNNDEIVNLLRSKKLKVTPQRIIITRLLLSGGHYTIDQVLNEVKKVDPSISISTVYNTLNTLVKVGILRSFEAEGKTWYEIRREFHINVICENSRHIMDIADVDLSWIEEELRKRGVKVRDINVIVHGDCP